MAQNSIFGWVLSGPIRREAEESPPHHGDAVSVLTTENITTHHSLVFSSLEDEIKRFWEVEKLPRTANFSADDERCEEHFCSTHSRSDDGRYIVRLPFKKGPPIDIGESRAQSEKLLDLLSRRLRVQPELSTEYADFLAEYERLGHLREAPATITSYNQRVYIPHHPVLREGSATTHLRVVFNASSLTSNGTTLNNHLLPGPKLQSVLPTIILKWRQFKYVYTADIAKMYRQIQVDSRDVDYQRILWKPSHADSICEFQLLTVTYGMTCAPFLELRVLKQLAHDEGAQFPLAAPILRENMYVDDVLFGANDSMVLRLMRNQLITLLQRGGFELRKWASNSPSLLSDIDAANHGLACHKSLDIDEKLKILGIEWNPALDVFKFIVTLADRAPESKRTILSAIAKLYDLLGWVTPVTITAKIFMQHLWREKLEWDQRISETLLNRWRLIYSRLSSLQELQIPRWISLKSDVDRAELHGFADASNVAYSAVTYLKVISHSGRVNIALLAAKSKVAPLSPLSTPRLELSAAVLLARLLKFIRNSVGTDFPCICWTDSTVVLAWFKQHPSRWKTFVANRVAEIHSNLFSVDWRHVPTEDNPADCASRGLLGDELVDHKLWWQGSSWLRHSQAKWPQRDAPPPANVPLEEKPVVVHLAKLRDPIELASRFSSWPRLIRVTAYIFRFIALCRRIKVKRQTYVPHEVALTVAEINTARMFWIKYIQAENFPNEIYSLTHNKNIETKSSILSLHPFLDNEGILRVGGRLNQAPLPYQTRHPILLAAHPLVRLIVKQAHIRTLHAGNQLTLSILRREFWIVRSRSIVKSVLHRCVVCTRERAAAPAQLMGTLPAVRVSAPTRSFLHCGLDYAGLEYLK